jgi:hypothetical protein
MVRENQSKKKEKRKKERIIHVIMLILSAFFPRVQLLTIRPYNLFTPGIELLDQLSVNQLPKTSSANHEVCFDQFFLY